MMGLLIAQAVMLAVGVVATLTYRRASSSPQPPEFWLLLIIVSLIPTFAAGLTFFRPDVGLIIVAALPDAVQTAAAQSRSVDIPIRIDLPWTLIYAGVAGLIFVRHLIQLGRLHCLHAAPNKDHADLSLSDTALPPFALGWPQRRIIVSSVLWSQLDKSDQAMLLAHERCHLAHRDPDVTFMLLALQSLFWINPGFRALVTGWREAIERRADASVVRTHNRRDYAKLFTRLARTAANLPVPTHSKPRNQGDLIMRLHTILESKPNTRTAPKRALGAVLGFSIAGTFCVAVAGASPAQSEPDIIKRVPPTMPASCPALADDSDIRILADEMTYSPDGMRTRAGAIDIGKVNLRYDIDAAGVPLNIKVTSANADCFRAPSIASVSQWLYAPDQPTKGVETQIKFRLMIEDGTTVEQTLEEFRTGAAGE